MDKEGTTLATEILKELKASAKRWFIISICELMIILAMAGGFVWYISLPVEDTEVSQDINNADSNNIIGIGDYNGEDKTESEKDTESSESEKERQ